MPNCFQLLDKGTKKPVKLQDVDDKMARAFGEEPDEKQWFRNWYNTIGMMIAFGLEEEDIMEKLEGFPKVQAVVRWLFDNYETVSWYSPRCAGGAE